MLSWARAIVVVAEGQSVLSWARAIVVVVEGQ